MEHEYVLYEVRKMIRYTKNTKNTKYTKNTMTKNEFQRNQ